MFKHHKYCVIEASGLLVAVSDSNGARNVYLLDNVEGPPVQAVGNGKAEMDALLLAADKGKKVRIADPALIEFICQLLQSHDDDGHPSAWRAQVTGTVDVDGGEVQLSYVSQAFIHDKGGLLKYEPH